MKQVLQFSTILLILLLLLPQLGLSQGATTGAIRGIITDQDGEPLIGATVTAMHTPSGTTYGTTTNIDGDYNIDNMRVGGPYQIVATYLGYKSGIQQDVQIRLGERQKYDFVLEEESIQIEGVEVVAERVFPGEQTGATTQISEDQLKTLPTINNNLNDFTRLTPQAKETFNGGMSIANMNNRFNAIYIDGAVNNDVFGLAASGTNGGQTGISPLSLDVIEQIQVVVSPYDVTYGGFAGGGLNAVTKSGDNRWRGTAYYYWKNEDLAGKTNSTLTDQTGSEATKLAPFQEKLYGLSIGGPIVKDKLFFFGNVEIQKDETPVPFDFGLYDGDSDAAALDNLRNTLMNEYGYDPGGYTDKIDKLEGTKVFGKIDWNLNQSHKLTIRHQCTNGEETDMQASENDEINFENNGVFFPSTTNSTAIEWNASFSNKFTNSLILGYTSVRDDRDPIGDDFPWVRIIDGSDGDIFFGSEEFSTANQLDQDIFTLTNNFKMYKGKNTWTFGTHIEYSSFYNLFIRQNFGSYDFGSVDELVNNMPAFNYDHSYSLVDGIAGDGFAAAAEFDAIQFGIYAQDEIRFSDKFSLIAGLRLDLPVILDDPAVYEDFNTTTYTYARAIPRS